MKEVSWATREFSGVELGDKRLNERLIKLCDSLSESPESSINQACEDWAETKAAYQFFKNEKVDSSIIVSAHRLKTVERVKQHKVILAIQDTSYIMYSHHPETTGLGKLTKTKGRNVKEIYSRGLLMHSCLAVTTEGLPLGLLDQDIVARADKEKKKGRAKDVQPIEEKESYRWLQSMKNAVGPLLGTQVVTVCDREADMFEFLELGHRLNTDVLVRANVDRAINKTTMYAEHNIEKLWNYMTSQPVSGSLYLDVQASKATKHAKAKEERTAKVEIRFGHFMVNPPKRLSRNTKDLSMYAVYVLEKDPPTGVEPLEWMLLTNLEVKNFDDALEKITWYKLRWRIEMFFKVLKSGFKVEDCRLGDGKRLVKYLTIMSILAWRLFSLTLIARSKPDTPSSSVLSPDEMKVLLLKNKKIQNHNPTIAEATVAIAKLGGFLARKNDGDPGTIVLWRGWKKLQDLVEGFNLACDARTCG